MSLILCRISGKRVESVEGVHEAIDTSAKDETSRGWERGVSDLLIVDAEKNTYCCTSGIPKSRGSGDVIPDLRNNLLVRLCSI